MHGLLSFRAVPRNLIVLSVQHYALINFVNHFEMLRLRSA